MSRMWGRIASMWAIIALALFLLGIAVVRTLDLRNIRAEQVAAVRTQQLNACQRENELREVLRGIMTRGRDAAQMEGRLTPRARRFYAQALADLQPVECSRGG